MANARRGFKVQLSSLTAAKCSQWENLFRIFLAYFSLNSRFAYSYANFSIHCNLSLIQANICSQNFLILLHFFFFLFFLLFAFTFGFSVAAVCLHYFYLFIYFFFFEVIAVANLISGFLVTHFQQSFPQRFFLMCSCLFYIFVLIYIICTPFSESWRNRQQQLLLLFVVLFFSFACSVKYRCFVQF